MNPVPWGLSSPTAADDVPPPTTSPIPRRRPVLGLPPAAVASRWYRGELFHTRFCDALSLFFPEGERFFVESVHHFRDRLSDPALRAAVADFVAQEAAHGRAHRAFNGTLAAEGLPLVSELEANAVRTLRLAHRLLTPHGRLAVTCALEHFTAILAEQVLGDPTHREAMSPEIRALWVWHALEETEHKAVAFDVYRAVGGGYARRVAVMLLTTAVFAGTTAYTHARLMAAEPQPPTLRELVRGLDYMWGRPGLMRKLIPAYLEYLKPSFHPDDRDTRALVAWGRNYLYGPGGLLEGQWSPS